MEPFMFQNKLKFFVFLIFLSFLFPKSINILDFHRLQKQIKIKIKSSSPAYIALRDMHLISQKRPSTKRSPYVFEVPEDSLKKKKKENSISFTNSKPKTSKTLSIEKEKPKHAKSKKNPKLKWNSKDFLIKTSFVNTKVTSVDAFEFQKKQVPEATIVLPFFHLHALDDSNVILSPYSNYVLEANAKGYKSGLTLISSTSSDESKEIKMLPEHFLTAFSEALKTQDTEGNSNRAMVWGQVRDSQGRPLSGIEVQMDVNSNGAYPIYVDGIIPNENLISTTRNGIFYFQNLPTDKTQSIRYFLDGKPQAAEIIPTRGGFVSYHVIEVGEKKNVPLEVRDPFRENSSVPSLFQIVGQETSVPWNENSKQSLELRSGDGSIWLNLDPGEPYALTRYPIPKSVSKARLHVVRSSWVQNLASEANIPIDYNKGVVIGFTSGKNFEVKSDFSTRLNTLCFGHKGEKVHCGGGKEFGFALFNLHPSVQQIAIMYPNDVKNVAYTTVVAPDPHILTVITDDPTGS